jgi:predicted dehydrogenase
VVNEQIGLDGQTLKYLITGTRGAIETDVVFSTLKRWTFRDGERRFESHGAECLTWTPEESFRYVHNTLDQTLDIIRRVQRGEEPKTPARDAYETMRLAFAAERSADEQRTVYLSEMPAL